MKKIDINELWKGGPEFNDNKIVLVAEKINEIIEWINSKKDQLL